MPTRGFTGRLAENVERIPPGQHVVYDFPVLTARPTSHIGLQSWTFTLKVGPKPVKVWNWSEFSALPLVNFTCDIHCVTGWSKLNTHWQGVLVDDIFSSAGVEPPTPFTLAHSFDGYSTNVPVQDLTGGKAMVALKYDGESTGACPLRGNRCEMLQGPRGEHERLRIPRGSERVLCRRARLVTKTTKFVAE